MSCISRARTSSTILTVCINERGMGLPLEKNGELDRDEIPYSFFSGYDAYTL